MWDAADAAGKAAMEGEIAITPATEAQLTAWQEALSPLVQAKLDEAAETGIDAEAAYEALKTGIAAEAAE